MSITTAKYENVLGHYQPGDRYPPEAFDTFFARSAVRATWIGFFVLFLIWGFLWLTLMSRLHLHDDRAGNAGAPTDPDLGATNGNRSRRELTHRSLKRATNLARDLLFGLLAALTINSFGRGTSVPGLILTWIYIVGSITWIATELLGGFFLIRLILAPIHFLILLAIFILAYALGWRYFSPLW
ncbi:hypothetical protein G9A89_000930 [Geosiphon pyriformis]|nr:hypothetical protein G9A89_000930 [Geosiphon pyriformis]